MAPLGPLSDRRLKELARGKIVQPGLPKDNYMNEDVRRLLASLDKAVPLGPVEPFDDHGFHRPVGFRLMPSRRGLDMQDVDDLMTPIPHGRETRNPRSLSERLDTGLAKNRDMQEHIASRPGFVGNDEPVPLGGIKPFDAPVETNDGVVLGCRCFLRGHERPDCEG